MAVLDVDDEVGVLDQQRAEMVHYKIRPDAPVLPSLASYCGCELAVKDNGTTVVFYDKKLIEEIHWVEYDIDLSMLTFVTWSGKVMGLGMVIHRPFRKYLKMASEIVLIHMDDDDKIESIYPAKLVVRHIGF